MSASKLSIAERASSNFGPFGSEDSHVVHFYDNDRVLLEELTRFLSGALLRGGAAVVIATEAHRTALARELEQRGVDLAGALTQGRYVSLDAADTLSQIFIDGTSDPERFESVIGRTISAAEEAAKISFAPVAIFGEMVALLWRDGNYEAAIRLEKLWNDLAQRHSFSLRCAYPMNVFNKDERGELFEKICATHSTVIPGGGVEFLWGDDRDRRKIAKLRQEVQALHHKKALRETEEKFRLLVETVQDYAIFVLDPEGRVSSWNVGAERIKGYRAAEILGKHFSCFFPEEDVRANKPERELEIARREGRMEDEGWRVRKDGTRFFASVVITVLKDSSGSIVGFAKVTRDVTEKMRAQQQLEESKRRLQSSEESLRRLSLRLLRTQDEERRRIARDLHDSLGQYLSVLKMKLDSLGGVALANDQHCAKELAQCAELTEEAIKEVRTISYLLYPPMLEELGLKSAVPWYLDGFTKRSGIKTTFNVSPGVGRLDGDVELVLFRVLQESLTNVHRHSGSPTADVQLLIEGDDVILEISDKGKGGMPAGSLEESSQDWLGALGVGLRGISERLGQVGGRLELSSTPEGSVVKAIVPAGHQPPA